MNPAKERRKKLFKERNRLIDYLCSKVEVEDWHGASDACNDLRDVDASLTIVDEWERTIPPVPDTPPIELSSLAHKEPPP